MMTEKDFFEYVEAVCKRPKMYTPTGSFYEVAGFLEGYSAGAGVGGHIYHFRSTQFRKWVIKKFKIQKTIIDWKEFRELFSSDLEALNNLPILYKEFSESL
ncbi:MAG: hypothetical protein ABI954_06115 [Pyrinomonadaceae bacterium]